ncbi:MAG: DUF5666 domain-containing protein [Candidatus Portnoybacteria bacterium]|nr:DUF5666 domain-containing protein [Candidatus Portnoybacteria bacterium]MDD4983032.1 DUF5666 domain-containing protein [Candidatus Portnoybacteria bacterium]
MKNKTIIAGILCALIFGAGGFFGGMKYQQGKTASLAQNFSGGQRQRGAGNFSAGVNRNDGVAAGEIIAKDDKSVTIKLRDGGSRIVFYSASTQLQKTASASQDELAVGKQVVANGTANSDGSITASQVQIRPDVQVSPSSSQ